jgi:imidazole glycerol-phosphate synthase subunit HisH
MIAIIDYKAGNLKSVHLAFENLGVPSQITRDPEVILAADRVVFPGDGAAESSMENLRELGLMDVIPQAVESGKPFLGICIGTQIIFDHSEEDGGIDCLGLIPGRVTRFQTDDPYTKIPQMGWNTIEFCGPHPLFDDIEDESEFYFIHSYYPVPANTAHRLAETEYADARFSSVSGHDNLVATQFHPERSGRIGLQMLRNFAKWSP